MVSKNQPTNTFMDEIRPLLFLALPLIAAGLAQMGMDVVDTLMMGRLGPNTLASGALGSAIFGSLLMMSIGIISAVGVLAARAYGAENLPRIEKIVRQGLWAALVLSVPVALIMWFAPWFLQKIGEDRAIIAGTSAFLHGLVWGVFPGLAFMTLREFVCALSRPRIVMIISALAIPLNALFNYILMYGKWGFPVLGIAGIGISTSLVEWIIFAAIAVYITRSHIFRHYKVFAVFEWLDKHLLKEILSIGTPLAILYGFEVGLFSVTTLMMGFFGPIALAAHLIALQSTSVAFMLPMGISQATSVRVSLAMGAKKRTRAKHAAYAGIVLGLGSAAIAACCFWLIPKPIIALFLDLHAPQNQAVVKLTILFLSIAAIFELMDALQVIMTGILRALKDTVMPMLLGLLSYWCVGLSAGYGLAFSLNLGGTGLWWGLAIGITVSAILLLWRFHFSIKVRN